MGEEEKERRLQKKKVLKRAVALIFAGLCIWYIVWCNIRVPRQFTGTFWSGDGEKIEVGFDLTWYRYLGVPSELRGTITIDGTTYTAFSADWDRSFFEKLWMKLIGKNDSEHTFIIRTNDPMDWLKDCIRLYVEEKDKQFEEIVLWIRDKNKDCLVDYYGPAETFEEARRIFFQKYGRNRCRQDFWIE